MTEKLTLKTSLLPLSTLELGGLSLDQISEQLAAKRAAAPVLFTRFPCILSLPERASARFSLPEIMELCEQHGILLIGATGQVSDWRDDIQVLRLAEFTGTNDTSASYSKQEPDVEERALVIHRGNVRSGQQLYSKGDLIVIGNINPGADVVAERDIHVYGHAQGRMIAGVSDYEEAIITGHHLAPELISIAGHYHTVDSLPHDISNGFTIVQLNDHKLDYISGH